MSNCQIIDEGDISADGKYFGCDIDVIDNVPQPRTFQWKILPVSLSHIYYSHKTAGTHEAIYEISCENNHT